MSSITYVGIFQENRETYSTYFIGWASNERMFEIRESIPSIDLYNNNEGYYETLIVKKYIEEELPLLWKWIREMKIPFGGIVNPKATGYPYYEIKFILPHHSQEDLAFRLCYNVKMEES